MTMATKKFTRGTRSRRSSEPNALHDHIETQRSRLMDAEAVLDCMLCAIDDDARLDGRGPSYPSIIRIARELIHSAIDQLDSVKLNAVVEADVSAETLTHGTSLGVRELAAAYVH
jgi:hypothetical protein